MAQTQEEIVMSLMASLNDINSLNRGGCLFAAYAVYLKAKELGIKTSIVQIDWSGGYDIVQNKSFLEGKVSASSSGNHFVVKLDKDLIDSNGIYLKDKGETTFTIRTHKDINTFCINSLKTKNWHSSFDREEGVKQIKEILGVDLTHCI